MYRVTTQEFNKINFASLSTKKGVAIQPYNVQCRTTQETVRELQAWKKRARWAQEPRITAAWFDKRKLNMSDVYMSDYKSRPYEPHSRLNLQKKSEQIKKAHSAAKYCFKGKLEQYWSKHELDAKKWEVKNKMIANKKSTAYLSTPSQMPKTKSCFS